MFDSEQEKTFKMLLQSGIEVAQTFYGESVLKQYETT